MKNSRLERAAHEKSLFNHDRERAKRKMKRWIKHLMQKLFSH